MNPSGPEISSKESTFETLKFDNLALRTLPIDPIAENYVRQVKNAVFSRVNWIEFWFEKKKNYLKNLGIYPKVKPMPLKNVRMVVYSEKAMKLLDLERDELKVSN